MYQMASGDDWKFSMKGRGSYVPPAYIPLEGSQNQLSDSEGEKDEAKVVGSNRVKAGGIENYESPQQWSSGICACCDDLQSCKLSFLPFFILSSLFETL